MLLFNNNNNNNNKKKMSALKLDKKSFYIIDTEISSQKKIT